MAITIVGQIDGSERDAAEDLAKRLESTFRPVDSVTIVAGAKCYGEKRQDIDLLIFGQIAQGFRIPPKLVPQPFRTTPIYLSSFALILEVKDHRPESVRFTAANHVIVSYREKPSNVSQQAFEQAHSVRSFLDRCIKISPWVISCIWLRNVAKQSLPATPHNILGADANEDDFLQLLVVSNHDRISKRVASAAPHVSISACRWDEGDEIRNALGLFNKKLEAGVLDRKKMEIVCQRILKDQQYLERLGKQLLVFRGRGGAGKTIRLLQLARTLHDDFGDRVLFLTYNKALVADVRRLLAILGISDKIDGRTIAIRSSDSYFFGVLGAFGISPSRAEDGGFPQDYDAKKLELRELLALTDSESIRDESFFTDNADLLGWDYVLIDEAQDWPVEERDILRSLLGNERLIVADGVDQFVRDVARCDWTENVPAISRQIVALRKSLRLKSNLCRFVKAFAASVELEWDMEPNDEVLGGRVRIILGEYDRRVHERILQSHTNAGNRPIDALMCITGETGAASAELPQKLRDWGHEVWDGTSSEGRDHYPTEVNQFRIVKYESCRGLEGWTVVCLDLDSFFDRQTRAGGDSERDLFVTADEAAARFATRWCLIPFTRAIDTLVLQFRENSPLATRLLPLARRFEDFVEVVRPG